MRPINYLRGDATLPQAKGNKVIAHVCNDLGRWGKGFVLAIRKRWSKPEAEYRRWHRSRAKNDFQLGVMQLVHVEKYIWIANMLGQRGIKTGSQGPPVRYNAIQRCLTALANHANELAASVHMPRIGCGLAGGNWNKVEPLVEATLCANDIAVYVYDYS